MNNPDIRCGIAFIFLLFLNFIYNKNHSIGYRCKHCFSIVICFIFCTISILLIGALGQLSVFITSTIGIIVYYIVSIIIWSYITQKIFLINFKTMFIFIILLGFSHQSISITDILIPAGFSLFNMKEWLHTKDIIAKMFWWVCFFTFGGYLRYILKMFIDLFVFDYDKDFIQPYQLNEKYTNSKNKFHKLPRLIYMAIYKFSIKK